MDAALAVLQAVADPIRWTVLSVLAAGPQCVCSLQGEVPIAGNLLSYHLKVLREAGLISSSGAVAGSTTRWPTTRRSG